MIERIIRRKEIKNQTFALRFFLLDNDDHIENHKSRNEFLSRYPKEVVLKEICKEEYSYNFLKEKYLETKYEKSNEYFATTRKISNRYFIELLNDDILLYTIQSPLKINAKSILEWDYPGAIYKFGKNGGRSIDRIIDDFNNNNTVEFFMKYVYNKAAKPLYDDPVYNENYAEVISKRFEVSDARFYELNDSIGVGIGLGQLYFLLIENGTIVLDSVWYVSDTWEYSDKQLLYRLMHWSIKKFGKDVLAGWESITNI